AREIGARLEADSWGGRVAHDADAQRFHPIRIEILDARVAGLRLPVPTHDRQTIWRYLPREQGEKLVRRTTLPARTQLRLLDADRAIECPHVAPGLVFVRPWHVPVHGLGRLVGVLAQIDREGDGPQRAREVG